MGGAGESRALGMVWATEEAARGGSGWGVVGCWGSRSAGLRRVRGRTGVRAGLCAGMATRG